MTALNLPKRRRTKAERDLWKRIWYNALMAMPGKIRTEKQTRWEPVTETVTVPEFIRESAHGRMRMLDDKPHREVITEIYKEYGRQAALTTALGLHTCSYRSGCLCHQRVRSGLTEGTRPNDPAIRERLLTLGNRNGKHLSETVEQLLGKYNEIQSKKPTIK